MGIGESWWRMVSLWVWPLLAAALLLLFTAAPSPVRAQEGSSSAIDVVVILDDSGSMATCWPWIDSDPLPRVKNCSRSGGQNDPSDPQSLRYSAARMLLQLAEDDDYVAVARFDTAAERLLPELTRVGGPDNRAALAARLQPPGSAPGAYQNRGYTRIDKGIRAAADLLAGRRGGRPQYVLFLTDGEPTKPKDDRTDQGAEVRQTVRELEGAGVQIFPVLLCNPDAGCSDTARSFLKQTMGRTPSIAQNAGDLVKVFGALFADMKPDLTLVNPDLNGDLTWKTRGAQGPQRFDIVTVAGSFRSLERDGQGVSTSPVPIDDNIAVQRVEGGSLLGDGRWVVRSDNPVERFVIVRAATFPEMLHPPVQGGPGGPRHVPAGKPVLVQGQIVGPGGDEPLLLDGSPLSRLSESPAPSFEGRMQAGTDGGLQLIRLQVGRDTEPLRIERSFLIAPRSGLPLLEAEDPQLACAETCVLRATFGPGAEIRDLEAQVYILQEDADVTRPFDSARMTCTDRSCSYDQFRPEEGRAYRFVFLAQARSGDLLFGDWAEAFLTTRPAIYVRGLPNPLDLSRQPEGGWPVKVIARTTEDLGRLSARGTLRDVATNTEVKGVVASLSVDIRGQSEQDTVLLITGYEDLPPGTYEGGVEFVVDRSTSEAQLPDPLSVTLRRATPVATINAPSLVFDPIQFEPSPNFRIDARKSLPITYAGEPFLLNAAIAVTTPECRDLGLRISVDAPVPDGSRFDLPLHLVSASRPSQGVLCTGALTLTPLDPIHRVEPSTPISWSAEIRNIVWDLAGTPSEGKVVNLLTFPEARTTAEQSVGELLVRYPAGSQFRLVVKKLEGENSLVLNEDAEIELSEPVPTEDPELYRVTLRLRPRRDLTVAWLPVGRLYSGSLQVAVDNISEPAFKTIEYKLYSPTELERRLLRFYTQFWFPALLCWPVTLVAIGGTWFAWRVRESRRGYTVYIQGRTQQVAHADPFEGGSFPPPAPPPPGGGPGVSRRPVGGGPPRLVGGGPLQPPRPPGAGPGGPPRSVGVGLPQPPRPPGGGPGGPPRPPGAGPGGPPRPVSGGPPRPPRAGPGGPPRPPGKR